jgi:hypothetical protein
MRRASKIAIYTGLASAIVLLAIFLAFALKSYKNETNPPYLDKTVQLSNSALLRIHGTMPVGAGGPTWELLYRENSGWEKVDDWMVEGQISLYSGDVLACPVGKLVVVTRTDGSIVFVRTNAGRWKTFHMELPERAPFPLLGANTATLGTTSVTAIETEKLQALRARMSLNPAVTRVPPGLGQFLPDKRELWVDYLAPPDRRFRLRMNLAADGEELHFLDFEERPFQQATDTTGPPLFLLLPDTAAPAGCSRVEFFPWSRN